MGHSDTIRLLLERRACVNWQSDRGTTLWYAAFMGHPRLVSELVALRANVNLASPGGSTPVYVAAQENKVDALLKLVELGASIDQYRENDGAVKEIKNHCVFQRPSLFGPASVTPLAVAVRENHEHIVRLLLHLGARMRWVHPEHGNVHFGLFYPAGPVRNLCKSLIERGGDLDTDESRKRRAGMLLEEGWRDPREPNKKAPKGKRYCVETGEWVSSA